MAAPGHAAGFSVMMADSIVELCIAAMKGGTQCFPLFVYEERAPEDGDLFSNVAGISKRSGITEAGLRHFQQAYSGEKISNEDVFYYIYGMLHSNEYRDRYEDNLTKELPRIPLVKSAEDFWRFVKAGRRLGELHVNFESAEPYRVTIKQGDLRTAVIEDPEAFYRVEKMRFSGTRGSEDKTTVIYNDNITMEDIPLEAYDYVVNGKPALIWVMERQGVLKDKYNPQTKKGSDIVNDANRYAVETMDNPAYPLELFQRVITVSLETMKIVRSLPKLDIDSGKSNPTKVQTLADVQSAIKAHWADAPAAAYALRIIDHIAEAQKTNGDILRVSDIVRMLDANELTGDIMAAMAILVQSEFAIFRAGGEFVDGDGERHELSPDDFQRVLDLDTVLHPITQDEVAKASEMVVPFFELDTEAFGGRRQ